MGYFEESFQKAMAAASAGSRKRQAKSEITGAQVETLRSILSEGGMWDRQLHMGRKRPHTARKTVVAGLVRLGLVAWDVVEDPARAKYRGYGVTTSRKCYVTSAGREALDAHDRQGVKVLETSTLVMLKDTMDSILQELEDLKHPRWRSVSMHSDLTESERDGMILLLQDRLDALRKRYVAAGGTVSQAGSGYSAR